MVARIFFTGVFLLLAIGGFLGAAPAPEGPLDPFGIVFLALAGVVWLGWEMIGDAYAYRKEIDAVDASDMTFVRLGPFTIKVLSRK
jgi:hypothetical protein